jgi:hypothetical protein
MAGRRLKTAKPAAAQRRRPGAQLLPHLIRPEKLRAASANRKVQALRKSFGWAREKKLIPANPRRRPSFFAPPGALAARSWPRK